jgi:hypothetical protein
MNEDIILDQNENLTSRSRSYKNLNSTKFNSTSQNHFNGFETQSQPNLGGSRHSLSNGFSSFNNNSNSSILFSKSHTKALKLFKDIKNLQSRLQNIE